VRILRLARFVARFGFDIAPETDELMREMVTSGEVDALVPERVWQELSRGVMEQRPAAMLETLHDCGALGKIAPELESLFDERERAQDALDALDHAASADEPLEVRFAALAKSLDPYAVETLSDRLKVPGACRDLAVLAARHANAIADAQALTPESILDIFDACDAWRRPERFAQLVRASTAGERDAAQGRQRLERARVAAAAIDAGAIAKGRSNAEAIRTALTAARLAAIQAAVG
jgi:tRNA nucleotidyltransferase (CCA-adding enzyme)